MVRLTENGTNPCVKGTVWGVACSSPNLSTSTNYVSQSLAWSTSLRTASWYTGRGWGSPGADSSLVSASQLKVTLHLTRAFPFRPKDGQIDRKWDKSRTFSDQISVHFSAGRQYVQKAVLKSNLRKHRICPILGQSFPNGPKLWQLLQSILQETSITNSIQEQK